jgi:hypothetical protein
MKFLNEEKIAIVAFAVSGALISFMLYFAAEIC